MNRVAKLIQAATTLRRRVWASLPWGIRAAGLFVRTSSGLQQAFGNPIYAIFLLSDIQGMPPVRGKSAEEFMAEFNAQYGDKNFDQKLSVLSGKLGNYGADFGKKAYTTLLAKFRNPELVEDTLSTFLVRFLKGGHKNLRAGSTLREAENYVLLSAVREGINSKRRPSYRQETGLPRDDLGQELDIRDPHALENIDEVFPEWKMPAVQRDLAKVNVDAPLYVKLVTEGYDDKEIVGNPPKGVPSMLPHYTRSLENWGAFIKPKIHQVLKKHLNPN